MKLLNLNICIKMDNTKEVIDFLKKEKADIITMQEAMHGIEDTCFPMYQSENQLIELEEYSSFAFAPLFIAKGVTKNGEMTRDFGGKAEQGSLLLSKYKIKEHTNEFYYREYKYEYDATNFKKEDWCRSIQNAIIKINDKELQIINVHGIWNEGKIGDDRTIAQSNFILSKLRKDIPAIVVGDFNLLPSTDSIKILNRELINLVEKYHIESTRPTFDDGLDRGNLVCDYIFVNNLVQVNDLQVLESYVSDHLPLLLDFEI